MVRTTDLSVVVPDTRPAKPLNEDVLHELRRFHQTSKFAHRGAVITDLDGTALEEREGTVFVAEAVAEGLKALADLGRPVVLNTLRFPLNVVICRAHARSLADGKASAKPQIGFAACRVNQAERQIGPRGPLPR